METKKIYQEIEVVAAALKRDGLEYDAERLLRAHQGIFNGTELFMAWRWNLDKILELPSISIDTREKAVRVRSFIDKALH